MRRHTYLFFLLIVSSHISTASTIPTVFVKAPKKIFYSPSSGPKLNVSSEQISASGATTLAEILQHLGGIQLQDTSGNSSQVSLSMRGFGTNATSNTLLLVNGIPITNPDMSAPDLNVIPVNEIELIEIIAGSESVLYGDQAVGGTINIVTHTHTNEIANLLCKVGSYQQRDCIVSISQAIPRLNLNVTLEDNHTDNYRENNRTFSHILLGNVNYIGTNSQLKFDYHLANENMRFPGALTRAQVKQNRRQAVNDTDFFKNDNGFLHIQRTQPLNATWQSTMDAAYRQMDGNGVLTSAFKQYRNSFFIKPTLKGKFSDLTLTTGMDLQTDQYRLNNIYAGTNDKLQKYGLFGLINQVFRDKTYLSIGMRVAQQNNTLLSTTSSNTINRAIATTIGTTYLLTPDASVYLRRAESFRFPKADENAFSNNPNGLRTQRGVAYETGAKLTKETYHVGIDLFALYLKDEINFDPLQTPQQPFGSNTNLAPTLRYGLTLTGKYPIYNNMTLDAQYHWVNARFQNGIYQGKRIPLVAENIFRTGIDWRMAKNWHAYSEILYTGSQFSDNDNENIAGKMGGYSTYGFNLRYQYLNFSAALHANNIFNKYYYFYTVYQSSMATQFFYPAPGRNFSLILKYHFV